MTQYPLGMKKPICDICNSEAHSNHPVIDNEENLRCWRCVRQDNYETDEPLQGIKSFTEDEDGEPIIDEFDNKYYGNGIVIWYDEHGTVTKTWINDGATTIKLTEEEQEMGPIELWHELDKMIREGASRCSNCNVLIPEGEGHTYGYSGIACGDCIDEIPESERKSKSN